MSRSKTDKTSSVMTVRVPTTLKIDIDKRLAAEQISIQDLLFTFLERWVKGESVNSTVAMPLELDPLIDARNRAAHSRSLHDIVYIHGKIEEMLVALNEYLKPASPPGDPPPDQPGKAKRPRK